MAMWYTHRKLWIAQKFVILQQQIWKYEGITTHIVWDRLYSSNISAFSKAKMCITYGISQNDTGNLIMSIQNFQTTVNVTLTWRVRYIFIRSVFITDFMHICLNAYMHGCLKVSLCVCMRDCWCLHWFFYLRILTVCSDTFMNTVQKLFACLKRPQCPLI